MATECIDGLGRKRLLSEEWTVCTEGSVESRCAVMRDAGQHFQMSWCEAAEHDSGATQGILNVDDDVEEEFEVDINEAEPQFLQGQSSRSGVEVSEAVSHQHQ